MEGVTLIDVKSRNSTSQQTPITSTEGKSIKFLSELMAGGFKPALDKFNKNEKQEKIESVLESLSFATVKKRDEIDEKMGYSKFLQGEQRLGWLVNIQEVMLC
jgi:hypothetical protein